MHKRKRMTRDCANITRREIRPRLRRDRPSGFTRSLRSHVQDDRGGDVWLCFYIRLSLNKTSVGHPERTQYAKFCVGEKPQSGASGAKPRNGATRNDDGIYKRLPIAFLGQMNCSECTNAQKRTRVCANIVCREIRSCLRIGRPTGFVRSFHSRIACNPSQ